MSSATTIDRKITRTAFKKFRERGREHGFVFVLPNASIEAEEEFKVRLRRISVQEKAAVNGISQEMQEAVYRRTRDLAKWQQEQQRKKIEPADQLEAIKQSETLINSIDAVCCAAFIDPPLVETEAELSGKPDAWVTDDFAIDDRWSAYQAITDGDSKEAKSLVMFRPESTTDAGDSGPVQDAPAPKRGTGAS